MAYHEQSAERASHEARIRKVWERYARTRSNWLKNVLIKKYTPLVNGVVYRQFRAAAVYHGLEDLRQIGMMGLLAALERYDPTKGPFQAYARRCIAGEILTYFARQRSVHTISFETKVRNGKGSNDPVSLLEFLAAPPDGNIGEGTNQPSGEQQVLLRNLIDRLPSLERTVVELAYFGELTSRDIASVLGLSPNEVGKLRSKAVAMMRRYLAEDEYIHQTEQVSTATLDSHHPDWAESIRRRGDEHAASQTGLTDGRNGVYRRVALEYYTKWIKRNRRRRGRNGGKTT